MIYLLFLVFVLVCIESAYKDYLLHELIKEYGTLKKAKDLKDIKENAIINQNKQKPLFQEVKAEPQDYGRIIPADEFLSK